MKPETTNRALAQKIADRLFKDGFGREADRLVMVRAERCGAGWCKGAVVDQIEDALNGK